MVESIIVISVVAIILAISVLLTIGFLGSNLGDSYFNQISRALELARATEMSQNTDVIMRPSADVSTYKTYKIITGVAMELSSFQAVLARSITLIVLL